MNENQSNLNNSDVTYCPNCGFKCDKSNRFCTNCGTPLAINNKISNNLGQDVQRDTQKESQQRINNSEVVYCSSCGFKCSKISRLCINCGAPITGNGNDNLQQRGQQDVQQEVSEEAEEEKSKKGNVPLAILAVIISVILPPLGVFIFILAILSLFSPQHKSFGIAVFSGFGTIAVFMIIMFGLCFIPLFFA